ncbi:MAG: ribosome recycling factor [Candidatus Nasuia deltocephalinicola]
MDNTKNFNENIEKYVKNFEEKIKNLNFNNIDDKLIRNIKVKENQEEKKIEDIYEIYKDEKNNLIIKVKEKNIIEKIENEIKKINKNITIMRFKDSIKINNSTNIITKEEIKDFINILKKEKERMRVIIRALRRKEINKNNEKEIEKIMDKKLKEIEDIYEKKIKNIR